MHRAALAHLGLADWSYQLLPAPPLVFEDVVKGLAGAGFHGANVTIPHKEAALALATAPTASARAIGAANTLTFGPDGELAADNTDAPGVLNALGTDPSGLRAVVLGAGGSARAVVHALHGAGADVTVWNRTHERAAALTAELGGEAVTEIPTGDLLVNCTSAGLDERTTAFKVLPLDADDVGKFSIVVDLVYAGSADTELIAAARDRGSHTVDGLEVLVHQGALSFEIWTGVAPPLDVMREAAKGTTTPPR